MWCIYSGRAAYICGARARSLSLTSLSERGATHAAVPSRLLCIYSNYVTSPRRAAPPRAARALSPTPAPPHRASADAAEPRRWGEQAAPTKVGLGASAPPTKWGQRHQRARSGRARDAQHWGKAGVRNARVCVWERQGVGERASEQRVGFIVQESVISKLLK